MGNLAHEVIEVSTSKLFSFSSERFLRDIYVSVVHGFILCSACHFMQVLHRQ